MWVGLRIFQAYRAGWIQAIETKVSEDKAVVEEWLSVHIRRYLLMNHPCIPKHEIELAGFDALMSAYKKQVDEMDDNKFPASGSLFIQYTD